MSDYLVKIIPTDPAFAPTKAVADELAQLLRDAPLGIGAHEVRAQTSEHTEFVDCGSNLTSIHCPNCGQSMSFDDWGDIMDNESKLDFSELDFDTPCCGTIASLNELRYDWPCGFARFQLVAENPRHDPSDELLAEVKKLLGCPVRVIRAHL
jgi:hypothetical protein